jgi:hypothetical protein
LGNSFAPASNCGDALSARCRHRRDAAIGRIDDDRRRISPLTTVKVEPGSSQVHGDDLTQSTQRQMRHSADGSSVDLAIDDADTRWNRAHRTEREDRHVRYRAVRAFAQRHRRSRHVHLNVEVGRGDRLPDAVQIRMTIGQSRRTICLPLAFHGQGGDREDRTDDSGHKSDCDVLRQVMHVPVTFARELTSPASNAWNLRWLGPRPKTRTPGVKSIPP